MYSTAQLQLVLLTTANLSLLNLLLFQYETGFPKKRVSGFFLSYLGLNVASCFLVTHFAMTTSNRSTVAQMAEQATRDQKIQGSIPA